MQQPLCILFFQSGYRFQNVVYSFLHSAAVRGFIGGVFEGGRDHIILQEVLHLGSAVECEGNVKVPGREDNVQHFPGLCISDFPQGQGVVVVCGSDGGVRIHFIGFGQHPHPRGIRTGFGYGDGIRIIAL